jgi:hypothetical protein
VKKHERENALSQVNVFSSNLSHFPMFASDGNSNAEPWKEKENHAGSHSENNAFRAVAFHLFFLSFFFLLS